MNMSLVKVIIIFSLLFIILPISIYGQGKIVRTESTQGSSDSFPNSNKITNQEPLPYTIVDVKSHNGLRRVRSNKTNKIGFMNDADKIVIPMLWDDADIFIEGFSKVKNDNLYGFISPKGDMISKPQWEDAEPFSDGLASVMLKDKWGFIDPSGNVIRTPVADNPIRFTKYCYGIVRTSVNDTSYIIDKKGHLWDDYEYLQTEIGRNTEILLVRKEDKIGFITYEGDIVCEPQYNEVSKYHDCFAKVKKDGFYGYVDLTGSLVIPLKWKSALDFSEGFALVGDTINGYSKAGFIDKTGTIVFPLEWDNIASYFHNGYAIVYKNGNPWILSPNGNRICAPLGKFICPFSKDGLAMFRDKDNNGLCGFIDYNGIIVIDQVWDDARSFFDGSALVKKDGKWGLIDTAGSVISPFQWDDVAWSFYYNKQLVKKGKKWLEIDKDGNIIKEYDKI